jgi:hypothetical protein
MEHGRRHSSKPITFIIKRTLTMVVVSVLFGRIEIGSEPVRDERYPLCGSPDRNNGSSG